jgi:hypothetical protein
MPNPQQGRLPSAKGRLDAGRRFSLVECHPRGRLLSWVLHPFGGAKIAAVASNRLFTRPLQRPLIVTTSLLRDEMFFPALPTIVGFGEQSSPKNLRLQPVGG